MPECKRCGKKGLFLKVQKGLCSKCLDALFDSPYAFITKEQFLNPPPIVPDEPIKRNDEYVPDGFVVASDGQRIEKSILPDFFQWDGIARIDKNYYELTSPENIQIAIDAIIKLNLYLDEAAVICNTIPDVRFDKSRIRFEFDPLAYDRNYCTLSFTPKSPSGKLPKSMVDLDVRQKIPPNDKLNSNLGGNLNGTIMFDNQGDIYHAEVTISLFRREEYPEQYTIKQTATGHKIICATQNGVLKIRLIYRIDNGYRKKVYDSKAVIE